MKKITIVSCDDGYEGLYVNGKLKYENHILKIKDLSDLGLLKIDFVALGDVEVLEKHGGQFPELISDLKLPRK